MQTFIGLAGLYFRVDYPWVVLVTSSTQYPGMQQF